ncbi:C2HC5 finger protein [Talaromyces proteolyticus]|uniref:C2HC5 finger protein n=1 Tax=Talaromyces proteolyticus TaxID=1131652 RepID=A0AAD4PYW3_9EURO|nr:C2HC5 finger protein [Talaromyces proteolyticus]KAH8695054.1 C2HC5 finger protein [Talaromyces proteolyticus]
MVGDIVAWAVPQLSNLLPLDEESLTQIVTYSVGLSKEDSAEHLKNLLGDSPPVLEFISSFNSRRRNDSKSAPQSGTTTPRTDHEDGRPEKSQTKKSKRKNAPLHSTGPPRRPDNYGDMSGAYRKSDQESDYMATFSRSRDTPSPSTKPAAFLQPKTTNPPSSYESSPAGSRNPSPAPKTISSKAPPSAAGPLISDYLPNVKSKAAKSSRQHPSGSGSGSGQSTPAKGSVTTTNIADLTSAIAALEVSTNPTFTKGRQTCNCDALIHPLFTPAPNCLSCGKIICSLEGLQPCSFCGTPLLSSEEIQGMIKELRAERGQEKMRAHNEVVHHTGGPGLSGSSTSPSKLDAAMAHRDKLLSFQAHNAQRTRVVDEAADFETPNVGSTQWMSPAQRALALKKQQRILREMEEKAKPEWERKKTIMSLDIKGGRVVRTYQAAPSSASADVTEEEPEEAATASSNDTSHGRAAFSKNPLLARGGLVRPIWKSTTSDQTDEKAPRREAKQTWRRVQDDNDDNEQWILDGGVHGYSNDSGA